MVLGHASETIEVRSTTDGELFGKYTTSNATTDEDSGDSFATVDFSDLRDTGYYFLYLPQSEERSYAFAVAGNVYDIVGAVAMKKSAPQ